VKGEWKKSEKRVREEWKRVEGDERRVEEEEYTFERYYLKNILQIDSERDHLVSV
jgi:hypothetical protein